MKDRTDLSPSEASTEDDEVKSSDDGWSLCARSEGAAIPLDASEGEDQCLELPPRGWSMRHGHVKKLAKPKRGKAAIWAEIQGQGKEVSRGRAVFARSVNNHGSNDYWYDDWRNAVTVKKRRASQDTIRRDTLEFEEETWSWEDYAGEDEWDWAPVDGTGLIQGQTHVTDRPVNTFKSKTPCAVGLDSLARRLKSRGAILEQEKFGNGSFNMLQKQILQEHGPALCEELVRSVNRTIHVMPAPVSTDVQERFLDARRTLPGALRPGYHGTDISCLPSIYEKGLLIPGQDNGIRVANGSVHGLGVYTARVTAPALSWGFCRAPTPMERRMVVCGILDDAPHSQASTSYTMGIRRVSRESQNIRHVGDAMVIFDDRRVAPFFEITIGDELNASQVPVRPRFDWARWQQTLVRIASAFPAKAKRGGARPLPVAYCKQQRLKQQTVIAYLTRRSASKRNPKIVSKRNLRS